MEPSKDPIAVRLTRLNRQIIGKLNNGGLNNFSKRLIDREALLDALTVLYDECNDDPIKKCDELVRAFVDKYRSTLAELRRTRVCISDFEIIQVIGRGHFGEVQLVKEKQTSDLYALKTLRKDAAVKKAAACAVDERDVLAIANSPWIPSLQYAFQDNSHLYLVMELCSGGDLAGMLARRNHPLQERDAAFYIAEVAHALKVVHSLGYVHRDVKPHNILLDRTGHIKLTDFGSSARLSEGAASSVPVVTPDYVSPELLAAADCAQRHTVCLQYCQGLVTSAISACDYWSLGVVAFELVTLNKPFSSGEEDSIPKILSNIQKYEREGKNSPPFDPLPCGPSEEWRSLVAGLLRVQPAKRFHNLDTLQHAALRHLSLHSIRDQPPPWVPGCRGPEDPSQFRVSPRPPSRPDTSSFRSRAPFAGQLPFVGFSYVAPDDNEESVTSGFSSSHDCTAIDLATYKSAEKLSAMRGREIARLQTALAEAEARGGADTERVRRDAELHTDSLRNKLQAEITALTLHNKRLERQIEIDKEERLDLERKIQELSSQCNDRTIKEVKRIQTEVSAMEIEKSSLMEELSRVNSRVEQLESDNERLKADAEAAKQQQYHYKESMAKERALRRQTLCGNEAESREAALKLASAEATAAKEARCRREAEDKVVRIEDKCKELEVELARVKAELAHTKDCMTDRQRAAAASGDELKQTQRLLTEERVKTSTLSAQVQELQQAVNESSRRESTLEEQSARTEARLQERLEAAEARATSALKDDARHREKVHTLEQLVRQLEREVGALESRGPHSDTESVDGDSHALREQLQRVDSQLQARTEELGAVRQELRAANLAKWRKEREHNDLSIELKSTTRELKRLEERYQKAFDGRKSAEEKCALLQKELDEIKPKYETAVGDLERVNTALDNLKKAHDAMEDELDRRRNDVMKLKSELQYSESRRRKAEEAEVAGAKERAQLRDEVHQLRGQLTPLEQNNKALQDACSLLEEQLTDLERLADLHEVKTNDLQKELSHVRTELKQSRSRLVEAERAATERKVAISKAKTSYDQVRDQAKAATTQLNQLKEHIKNSEKRINELEAANAQLSGSKAAKSAALNAAMARINELQEECATQRTRTYDHHHHVLTLQAQLHEAQEELSVSRETAEATSAWWRTRETKADATIRQQAKLIDFLQAKVEESQRKKCSLSNKLFGKSGRRPISTTSPPLRKANRELREEVEKLRAQLAVSAPNGGGDTCYATPKRTPKRSPKRKESTRLNGNGIDVPDTKDKQRDTVQLVWRDGSRSRVSARLEEGAVTFSLEGRGARGARGYLTTADFSHLPHNEQMRAFAIKCDTGEEAVVVCNDSEEVQKWVRGVCPVPRCEYEPTELVARPASTPLVALHLGNNALALGCSDGLYSLRGPIALQWDQEPYEELEPAPVTNLVCVSGRCVMVYGDKVVHAGVLSLVSGVRRSSVLRPTLHVTPLQLPHGTTPHLLKVSSGPGGDGGDGGVVVAGCGRRVVVLQYCGSSLRFSVVRSLTADTRGPLRDVALAPPRLYVAASRPLALTLPSSPLLPLAPSSTLRTDPRAILLVSPPDGPVELLVCYVESAIFVDADGKRTRTEDVTWKTPVNRYAWVAPFLYLTCSDRVSILYVPPESYRAPPCTCDDRSSASTPSDCYSHHVYDVLLEQPEYLGLGPEGIMVRVGRESQYRVVSVEGIAAYRSIGASVESLTTISSDKGSSTDIITEQSSQETIHDTSQESIEPHTGFLADIRKRAQQLRKKNRKELNADDVIKEILTSEVGGPKRMSNEGRFSPASISEFSSDADEEHQEKTANEVCAELFTRQVRFQY